MTAIFISHNSADAQEAVALKRWLAEPGFARHMDYVHYNAVKHGHVRAVVQWPYSTFHRWVRAGMYQSEWGGAGVVDGVAGERG